jgi:hypothetical protein
MAVPRGLVVLLLLSENDSFADCDPCFVFCVLPQWVTILRTRHLHHTLLVIVPLCNTEWALFDEPSHDD